MVRTITLISGKIYAVKGYLFKANEPKSIDDDELVKYLLGLTPVRFVEGSVPVESVSEPDAPATTNTLTRVIRTGKPRGTRV